MFKYVSRNCHTSEASYSAANAIARHGKPFQEGEFLKEAWLACAPSLFDDFDNKDKIIQRIKDVPLSISTIKDRILKLAENVTDQQKNDINSTPFISLCLDESIDITKSARLAVFARYCVGNIIKEELIAITSLLTTTKGTDICTAVRDSLAEKEIDLKKIVSVTTDGAPNIGLELTEDSVSGLCSHMNLKCKNCSFFKGFPTTEKMKGSCLINSSIVLGLRIIGKGFSAGKKLCAFLGLPFLSKLAFRNQERKLLKATERVAQENINAALS
ncbi:uncharacterized protein TNCV_4382621 [Trichonephila clavipes]|nr:uncharacterized protein TNCV_4382621 [Trichonephila clavipes]